ncbi:MAG: amino acid permease, partial [Litorilinea sp.]
MTKQITTDSRPEEARPQLLHTPGMFTAIMLGLGSVLGTGVFVSLGIGAQVAGPAVMLGLGIAAVVALCSGVSTAQIATAGMPSSGAPTGTFEYGSKYLHARLGFSAAWLFLWAKSASAATAALGIAGYILSAFGIVNEFWRVGLGLVAVLLVVALVLRGGMPWTRLTTLSNLSIGGIALIALAVFMLGGLPATLENGRAALDPFFLLPSSGTSPVRSVLHAAALMFV